MSKVPVTGSEKKQQDPGWTDAIKAHVPVISTLMNYKATDAIGDSIAGFTVGLTMLPQSIAYAALAELNPQVGVNSTFAGVFVYMMFGSIREIFIGPSSLMALFTAEFTRDLTDDHALLLTFLAGIVEILISILHLGFMVELISSPAFSGFSSATALIIIVAQLKSILGIKYRARNFFDNFFKLYEMAPQIRPADTVVGIAGCFLLLLLRSLKDVRCSEKGEESKKSTLTKVFWFISVSKNAIIVVLFTMLSYYFATSHGSAPFLLSGQMKSGIPSLTLPPFSTTMHNKTIGFTEMVEDLGTGIIIIPIVTVLINLSIANAYASVTSLGPTHEIFVVGLCNIANSCFGAMPTSGAYTRSGVGSSSGVRTPLANFFTGVTVLLGIYFLSPFFQYIPRPILAAVLIVACMFLVEVHLVSLFWKTNKMDLFTFLVTFSFCLVVGVEKGLLIGVACDICRLIYLWARPDLVIDIQDDATHSYILVTPKLGFFFPAVDHVCSTVNEVALSHDLRRPVIFDCVNFKSIDYTAARGLFQLAEDFQKRGQDLIFINVHRKVERFGLKMNKHLKICRDKTEVMEKLLGGASKVSELDLKEIDEKILHNAENDKTKEEEFLLSRNN
ncbi:unnamed protein product [Bemisia tabaci]|uniref:STAS domain-containing protein n=1 Tax=Bemisia tabaci TaxID=7038 RepID=A0A9P0ACQ6_BEMTA|nr:unnamed protein product [Bemisia tabaci]